MTLSLVFVLSACTLNKQELTDKEIYQDAVTVSEKTEEQVIVELKDVTDKKVGQIVLFENNTGVTVRLKAENLPPGKRAFHIHETGKCEKPDFKSAGSHYNPYQKEHGFDNPIGPHAGDLPNIEVGADGKIEVEINAPLVTLEEGKENSLKDLDGTAFIIHAGADDYSTDPAGNAGDRIVCGVLQK